MIVIKILNYPKKNVKRGEQFVVKVQVEEIMSEPMAYRLPFNLGRPKGGIK